MTTSTYENGVAGFRLSIPDEWTVIENHLGAAAVLLEPRRSPDGFRASIAIVAQENPGAVDLDEFVDGELKEVRRFLTDHRVIERAVAADGSITLRSEYRQGVFEVSLDQTVIPAGDRVFTLTSTSAAGDSDRLRDVGRDVYESFEVLDPVEAPPISGPS